jgi:anti-anti-sigma factor
VGSFELEHEVRDDSDVAFVAFVGELDLTNADDLVAEMEAIAGERPLVIDLSRLLFLDSAALHGLFQLALGRGSAGLAVVIDPRAPVAATLEIVEFRKAATVVPSRARAEAALARARGD